MMGQTAKDATRYRGEALKPKRYLWGRIVVSIVRFLAHILLEIQVEGAERIPTSGPVVMLGNHVNFLDPVLPYIIVRRYVKGLTAAETYRRFLFNLMAWSVDAIPVERGTPDLSAIRACIQALEAGWALYIAPEGTRSGDGRLQRGRAGVVLILSHVGPEVPIYPLGFAGLEHFWPNIKRLRRTRVHVRVGEPFHLCLAAGQPSSAGRRIRQAEREQIITEIMGQIAALLPPENRGLYADQVGRAPQYLCFDRP